MPLRGSGGDENGRLTVAACITPVLTEGARRKHQGLSPLCEAGLRGFSPCIPIAGMVQLF
jgi:hypothetical protein